MREDMHELLVERPRGGRRIRHTRHGLNALRPDQLEALPKRSSTGRDGPKTKWLNENLAPLHRYLERQLGRPWNTVYGEIRARLRFDNPIQLHVLQHLRMDVELHVDIVDGVPHRRESGVPLRGNWHSFYVCPNTGLLRRYQPRSRRPDAAARRKPKRKRKGSRR